MLIRIDKTLEEPLYLQIRAQIITAIAQKDVLPGEMLPSVRSLASDLGINLHTVNKAYAVLRDEGYISMRGRASAVIADPAHDTSMRRIEEAEMLMQENLYKLALVHRARGGTEQEFAASASSAVKRAFGKDN